MNLGYQKHTVVYDNSLSENEQAVRLFYAENCTIMDNEFVENDIGILINHSHDNRVYNNTVSCNDEEGLYLQTSDDNFIWNNRFEYNGRNAGNVGVKLTSSQDNFIYLNDFYDNVTTTDDNVWNSPTPLTYEIDGNVFRSYMGNFWWNYTGTDQDGDYIGEDPYLINAGDQDDYPLMEGFGNYTILTGIENVTAAVQVGPLAEYLAIGHATTDLAPYRRYMYVGYNPGIARIRRGTIDALIEPLPHVPQGLAPLRNAIWYYEGSWLYSTAGDAIDVGSSINDIALGRMDMWLATDAGVKRYDPRSGVMTDVYAGQGHMIDASRYGMTWFVVDDKLVRYTRSGMTEYNLTLVPNSISVGRRGVWLAFGDRLAFFDGSDWTWYNDTQAQFVTEGRRITWFTTPTGYGYIKRGELYEFQGSLGTKVEMDWSGTTYFMAPEGVNIVGKRGKITHIELDPPLMVQGAYWPYYVLADWTLYKMEDENGTAVTGGTVPLVYAPGYVWTADDNDLVRVKVSDGNVTRVEIPYDEPILGIAISRYGVWFYTSNHVGLYDTDEEEFSTTVDVGEIVDACADRRGNFWFIKDGQVGMVSKDGTVSTKDLAFTPVLMALGRRTDIWMVDDTGQVWRLRRMATDPELVLAFASLPKDMIADRRGNPWFAFDGFITKYDARRGEGHVYWIDADRLELTRYGDIMAYKDNVIHLISMRTRFY